MVCSLFVYLTQGVIKREQLQDISKLIEISNKNIKNQDSQQDNPDFVWIFRDFDFQVPGNDSKAYLESKVNKTIFSYFQKHECSFLPNCYKTIEAYKTALNQLKSLIFGSLLRKKTLKGSLMNGAQVAEFFSLVSKQLNETNVINYGDLSITFHNTAKEYLKSMKIKLKNKLESLRLPMNCDEFDVRVSKFKEECLKELKSNIKDDEDFQKEYIDDYSNFVDDKKYFFETSNARDLEELHKGILTSLKGPIEEKIKSDFYKNNEKKLDDDLNEIVSKYKTMGIESPLKEKVLNEQFLELSKMLKSFHISTLKIVEEKNGEICILERLKSFSKEIMKHFKDFPLPEDKFNNKVEELKNSEIVKLEGLVTNEEVLLKLKEKFVDLLNKELEDIKIYNSASKQNSNEACDIFLSYCRKGLKKETKMFREKLEKETFNVWHDQKCLPNSVGEDYKKEILEGINSSRIFLFIWNQNYSKSDNCIKEFKWAVSKKKKIICIELEKLNCDLIQFDLKDDFTLKLYHSNSTLSKIPEIEFKQLIESIKKV